MVFIPNEKIKAHLSWPERFLNPKGMKKKLQKLLRENCDCYYSLFDYSFNLEKFFLEPLGT